MNNETTGVSFTSASSLLKEAFVFYFSHWKLLMGISLIPALLYLFQFFLSGKPIVFIIIFGIMASILALFCRLAFFDAVIENGEPEGGFGGAFKKGLGLFFPFFWISVLTGLAIFGGFYLLIIPGLLLAIRLSFSVYALLVEGHHGTAALATSWSYTKGRWWGLFWRFLFLGILVLLVSLLLGFVTGGMRSVAFQAISVLLNNLLFLPISFIYSYLIYRSLQTLKPPETVAEDREKLKKPVVAFAVIGLVGTVAFFVFHGAAIYKFLNYAKQLSAPPSATTESSTSPSPYDFSLPASNAPDPVPATR